MDYIALIRQIVSDYLLISAFDLLPLFCMFVVFGFYQVYLHSCGLDRFYGSTILTFIEMY